MSRSAGNPRAMAGQLAEDASEVDLTAELQVRGAVGASEGPALGKRRPVLWWLFGGERAPSGVALARATGGRRAPAEWVECWSLSVASFCFVTAGCVLTPLATVMVWFFWPEPRCVFCWLDS